MALNVAIAAFRKMNFSNRHLSFPALMLAGFVCTSSILLPPTVLADEVMLQDDKLLAAFDSDSGALLRLENVAGGNTHWVADGHPELAVPFRFNLFSPGNKHDYVYRDKQHAAAVQKISDQEIHLQWKDLVDEQGRSLPMTLTADVTLTNGTLTFNPTVQNDSSQMIESVDYPYMGGFNEKPEGTSMTMKHLWYGGMPSEDISGKPPGVQSKQSLFCLMQSTNTGLYVEMHDPTQPYLLNFIFERHSLTKSSNGPMRTEFHTSHVAYVHTNSTVTLAPVVMQFYRGDWHAGVDLYKAWRATWYKQPHLPAWIQDVNSWQQLQIDSPEQDFRVPYTNLISYAQQCADNGVAAIQLVGWNNWGQDGGDPAQDIEPGLGTWQELHDFVAQSQAKGVNIILFAKLNWADLTMPRYTNEFYKYECIDPAGKRYEQGGYQYFTPTQLSNIGVHRRAVMDFSDPEYRDVATKEFEKILALGSAGWLWDEVCHHASVLYNYAPGHGYNPPGYIYGGDMPLGAQLRAAADKVSPDFLFSGEGPEDWLTQYFPLSYFRINIDSVPVCRYIDSQEPLMVAVVGYDDREMLNLILMDRYIIEYEPQNFKGYLEEYPLTLAYGKKIDALRRKYKEYLWDATFRDTLGANVTSDGNSHYSVFVTASGKRAVVVVNMEYSKAITARVELPNPGKLLMASPEHPDTEPTDGTLNIPARSAIVVMEQ
jgi:hypothetical protein